MTLTRIPLFARFFRDEEGSVIVLVAVAALLFLTATGAAVDMARGQILQAKISSALDAAGLAAGATASTVDVQTQATRYFNLNFPSGYLGSGPITPHATLSADKTTVTLTATASQATTFMKVVGINTVTVGANSQITRATSGLELVLVLDNSGSMNNPVNSSNSGTPKITALQSAAAQMLNILYGSNTTVPNLWIGLVPFSQAVNIGTAHTSWLNATFDGALDWGPTSWKGCVNARSSPYDISDDLPTGATAKLFEEYYFPSTSPGGLDPWKTTTTSRGRTTTTYTVNSTEGPNLYCPQQLTPMTASKTTITNGINSMVAAGDTDLDIGLAWGYRLLSPNWRASGSWTGWGGEMATGNLPLDYNTPLMNKVVILMTDGWNHYLPGNFTAYGFLSDNQLGTTSESTAESTLDTRTLSVCSTLKSHGVVIYTIGFGVDDGNPNNPSSVNGSLLKSCATDASHYFLAPTNAELQSVFQQIGDSLANLRVSQ